MLILHGLADVIFIYLFSLLVLRSYGASLIFIFFKVSMWGASPAFNITDQLRPIVTGLEKWLNIDLMSHYERAIRDYSLSPWSLHFLIIFIISKYFLRRQMDFAKSLLWALLISNVLGPTAGSRFVKAVTKVLPRFHLNHLSYLAMAFRRPWLRLVLEEVTPPIEDRMYRSVLALRALKWLGAMGFMLPSDSPTARRSRIGTLSQLLQIGGKIVNDFDLPAFIRSPYQSRLTEVETIDLMKSLGYPTNAQVQIHTPSKSGQQNKPWWIGRSDWKMHLPMFKSFIQEELEDFRKLRSLPVFKHSYTYGTLDSQVESISRYFYESPVSMTLTKDDYDIVWDLVKDIYANSQLAPISEIYRKWDKKMNVGVFASSREKFTKFGSAKKMPRWEYIRLMGGHKKVIKQWYAFFKHYPRMENFAQYFTKAEFLPPKKWLNDVVRTPVASMLPQYVSQMVWSGVQNHRFRPFETPVKIGLPINGTNLSKIYALHEVTGGKDGATHFAGDCSAFDSTLTGPVLDVIKHVRKRGFKDHRAVKAISWLVDRNYAGIEKSLLVSSNTGDIARKGSGLMTGHASTSADNSLAMVALYALAWRKLTGTGSQEFLKYNTLSVYGDDHILSIARNAPVQWTFPNVQSYLASCNITLREEVQTGGKGTKLESIPFLSKMARRPSAEEAHLFESLGIEVPRWTISHDREKLLGKMTAQLPNQNPLARAKRMQSYLYLCAHNPEAYEALNVALNTLFGKFPKVEKELGKYTPSYARVLKVWYDPDSAPKIDEDHLVGDDDGVSAYGGLTAMDQFLNATAALPDYFNPIMKNNGWVKSIQQLAGTSLFWPNELIQRTNSHVSDAQVSSSLRKSCYSFLEHRGTVPSSGSTLLTLLLRHWLFILMTPRSSTDGISSVTKIADGVSASAARWNFVLLAKDTYKLESASLHLKETLFLWILGFLEVPFELPSIFYSLRIPDPVEICSKTIELAWNQVWVRVPVAFRALGHIKEDTFSRFLVTAKTGIGKSTTLVNYLDLENVCGLMIVIVPRSNLVTGLMNYMNKKFGEKFTGLTTGLTMDTRRRVVYMTAQEFLINFERFNLLDHMLVLDECHIDELPYKVIKALILKNKTSSRKTVMMTATAELMSEDLTNFQRIDFPQARLFSIRDVSCSIPLTSNLSQDYARLVLNQLVHARQSAGKALIFVDSLEEAEQVSTLLPMSYQVLHSRGEVAPNPNVEVYIGTSMVDVGITIPGLSLVISKDMQYRGGQKTTWKCPSGHCGMEAVYVRPQYEKLPSSLVTQRRGRTGRTSNGEFVLVNVTAMAGEIAQDISKPTPKDMVEEWIASNLPLHLLVESGILGLATLSETVIKAKLDSGDERRKFSAILKLLNKVQTESRKENVPPATQFTGHYAGLSLSVPTPFIFQKWGLSSMDMTLNSLRFFKKRGGQFRHLLQVMKYGFSQDYFVKTDQGTHLAMNRCIRLTEMWQRSQVPGNTDKETFDEEFWTKALGPNPFQKKITDSVDNPWTSQYVLPGVPAVLRTEMHQGLLEELLEMFHETCPHGVHLFENVREQKVCLACTPGLKLPDTNLRELSAMTPKSLVHFADSSLLKGGHYVRLGTNTKHFGTRPLRGQPI